MALNYSHRPIFRIYRSEENLVLNGSQDKDIHELLPDPFGIDISSTVTAITGWLEDLHLGADYGGYGGGEVGVGKGEYPLFAGWNFLWNTATMDFQTFPDNKKADDRTREVDGFFPFKEFGHYDGGVSFACTLEGSKCGTTGNCCFDRFDYYRKNSGFDGYIPTEDFGHSVYDGISCTMDGAQFGSANAGFERIDNNYRKNIVVAADSHDDGAPHPALGFALAYLGVRDLLSVEKVCKSLRFTVQTDPLLWRSIHIEQSLHELNERFTDYDLLQLTNRAQGNLQCLSLVQCKLITDNCLKRVLESNVRLTKLSVTGCTKLSIDGVVNCLRSFKLVAVTGIKYLRVGGLYNVTQKHFEELLSLLGIPDHVPENRHKPHFYHRGNIYLPYEDDRFIDIEICLRCQVPKLVYDCPVEDCQGKDHPTKVCRACINCIQRCIQCGKCINDSVYEETFCLEFLCSDCWKQVLQCQENQDVGNSPLKHAVSQEPLVSFHG